MVDAVQDFLDARGEDVDRLDLDHVIKALLHPHAPGGPAAATRLVGVNSRITRAEVEPGGHDPLPECGEDVLAEFALPGRLAPFRVPELVHLVVLKEVEAVLGGAFEGEERAALGDAVEVPRPARYVPEVLDLLATRLRKDFAAEQQASHAERAQIKALGLGLAAEGERVGRGQNDDRRTVLLHQVQAKEPIGWGARRDERDRQGAGAVVDAPSGSPEGEREGDHDVVAGLRPGLGQQLRALIAEDLKALVGVDEAGLLATGAGRAVDDRARALDRLDVLAEQPAVAGLVRVERCHVLVLVEGGQVVEIVVALNALRLGALFLEPLGPVGRAGGGSDRFWEELGLVPADLLPTAPGRLDCHLSTSLLSRCVEAELELPETPDRYERRPLQLVAILHA